MNTIGKRIKSRRRSLGPTQGELADRSNTVQSQISRYEKGQGVPDAIAIWQLAIALDVSADWLIGLSDDMTAQVGLSEEEKELIKLYRSVPESVQQKIIGIAKLF